MLKPLSVNTIGISPEWINRGGSFVFSPTAGADCIRKYAFSENSNKLDFEPNDRYIQLIN